MDRNEMYKQSPLRILERARSGKADGGGDSATVHGLGRGNLGVVMARAGVGPPIWSATTLSRSRVSESRSMVFTKLLPAAPYSQAVRTTYAPGCCSTACSP